MPHTIFRTRPERRAGDPRRSRACPARDRLPNADAPPGRRARDAASIDASMFAGRSHECWDSLRRCALSAVTAGRGCASHEDHPREIRRSRQPSGDERAARVTVKKETAPVAVRAVRRQEI